LTDLHTSAPAISGRRGQSITIKYVGYCEKNKDKVGKPKQDYRQQTHSFCLSPSVCLTSREVACFSLSYFIYLLQLKTSVNSVFLADFVSKYLTTV